MTIVAGYNYPLLSIPVAIGLAHLPVVAMKVLWYRATGDYNNLQPRGNLERDKNKVTQDVLRTAKRLEGAHLNGLESIPVYSAAVLAAVITKVPVPEIEKWVSVYLVSRVAYNILYGIQRNKIMSTSRSIVWLISIGSSFKLLLLAAARKF